MGFPSQKQPDIFTFDVFELSEFVRDRHSHLPISTTVSAYFVHFPGEHHTWPVITV
jgi:hypothetical protein